MRLPEKTITNIGNSTSESMSYQRFYLKGKIGTHRVSTLSDSGNQPWNIVTWDKEVSCVFKGGLTGIKKLLKWFPGTFKSKIYLKGYKSAPEKSVKKVVVARNSLANFSGGQRLLGPMKMESKLEFCQELCPSDEIQEISIDESTISKFLTKSWVPEVDNVLIIVDNTHHFKLIKNCFLDWNSVK